MSSHNLYLYIYVAGPLGICAMGERAGNKLVPVEYGCPEAADSLCTHNTGSGPTVSLTLCCFVVYSTRQFVLCLTLCHFVLVFFSPFSIAITSLVEERANLSAFRTFVRFVLVWICQFALPLAVWEGLQFVIMALPGLFSYLFFFFFSFLVVPVYNSLWEEWISV